MLVIVSFLSQVIFTHVYCLQKFIKDENLQSVCFSTLMLHLIFFNRKTVDLLLFFFHSDFCFRASKRTNINISCCLLGRSMKSSRLSTSLPSPQMAWKSRALGNQVSQRFPGQRHPHHPSRRVLPSGSDSRSLQDTQRLILLTRAIYQVSPARLPGSR